MRVFSGIRPSGQLHIGNYFGAIAQWVKLQQTRECLFCIVDLHAITTPYDPARLRQDIKDTAIAYLASGVNPDQSVLFVQSHVPAHPYLAWLLGAITPLGDLQRMTQFKEKSKKHRRDVNAGLLNYPVLMASDILLYKADYVPVGQDQKQHVELARALARKFNRAFGQTFPEPQAVLAEGAKIMSLQNPKQKMSKTDNPLGCVALFDSPDEIRRKIMSAVTDSGKAIKYDPAGKPGLANLVALYSLLTRKTAKQIEKQFKGKGYAPFKKSLAAALVQTLEPFRLKKKEYSTREVYLQEMLSQGARKAQLLAEETLKEVKQKMGLS